MLDPMQSPRVVLALLPALLMSTPSSKLRAAPGGWTQWGGPTRNFIVDATGLASTWPSGGPKKLWRRALGEGHSTILVEGGRLYTQYRPSGPGRGQRSQQEV